MNVSGARCLVIGGARRLGRELALDLARHEAAVVISSRVPGADASSTLVQLQTLGGQAGLVYGDVTRADSAAHLVEDATAALHGLDAVVYAASGPFSPASPEELGVADWDKSFEVIAKGFFLTARAAHHVFVASGGRDAGETQATRGVIVAITDPLAEKPSAAFTAHAAAKAAQVSLVKSLAVAWADDSVRVCGLAPGPVDLPEDPHRAAALRAAERAALKRLVKPAEVGQAVRFCIENDYLNGANLTLDGGLPPVWAGVIER